MKKTKVPMPNRERFLAICRSESKGTIALMDWFYRPLVETPEEWIKQGAPEEIRRLDAYNRYFKFECINALREIVCGLTRADLMELEEGMSFIPTPPIVPVFEKKIIEKDERHRIETTYGGVKIEISKEFPWRMPKYLDHPVKDWTTWKEYKKRLDPYTPERWPKDWNAFVKKTNSEDAPTLLLMSGFFGVLREWMGLEKLLYTFYDDPKLVEDMMDQVLYLVMGVAYRVVKNIRVDFVRFWEDMAFKSGPLISPDMFKKFMIPRYKQIIDFLRSNNIDIIQVDSDGNINELLPTWLEVGLNFFWPLEAAAGMDAVALRKKYGKEIILVGNIDKRVFARGKEAIREEVMSKVPFLVETGGYFPSFDHLVPPDVSLENFRYFQNLLREIGGLEKLPE